MASRDMVYEKLGGCVACGFRRLTFPFLPLTSTVSPATYPPAFISSPVMATCKGAAVEAEESVVLGARGGGARHVVRQAKAGLC